MKTTMIEIEITGIAPLLHNRFPVEEHGINKSSAKKKVYDPVEEANKCLYQEPDGTIYQPAEHIFQSMIKSGAGFQYSGKTTYKNIIASGINITPENIPLNIKTEYEIDARPVVIQRARVIKWRPRFNEWSLKFTLEILDAENISVSTVKDILETAGKTKGIGDYRPRFGRFMVSEFKEVNGH